MYSCSSCCCTEQRGNKHIYKGENLKIISTDDIYLIVFSLLTSFASLIFQHDGLAIYFTNVITLVSCKLYFYLGFPRKSYMCSLSISAPLITSKSFSRVQTDLTGVRAERLDSCGFCENW